MIREYKTKIVYEEYWMVRGVTGNKTKTVVTEEKFSVIPTEEEIITFLLLHPEVEFVSIEHNYKLARALNEGE